MVPSASARATSKVGSPDRVAAILENRHVLLAGSCLVLVPNLLFALHLQTFPALAIMAGIFGTVAVLGRRRTLGSDAVLTGALDVPRLCICLALSLAIVVLGGEAHLVFTNWDWLWRDAVLSDVARAPFPPAYQVDGRTLLLRAPLGMYMLPALVAKAASLAAGHAALLAQNTVFLSLILYMLATLSGRRSPLVIVVFLSFSGLDVVGHLLGWWQQGKDFGGFSLPSHIESWSQFQYSSVVTQIFWVPNHALPAYWLVLIVVLCVRREATLGDLGLVMAASLFWSPFAFIGTLPFAGYLFVRDARHLVVSPHLWLAVAVAACYLPVALYMQVDAAKVPHAFVLFMPTMAAAIVSFLVIEIPHIAIIRETWPSLDPRLKGIVIVSFCILVLLPVERFGVSNDLVMRASIPALMILSIAFADALAIAWATRRGLFVGGLCLLLLGAVTPAQEIIRSLSFAPFAISDCNLVTVWKKLNPALPTLDNYLARRSAFPAGLIRASTTAPLSDQPRTVCWPDIPIDASADVAVSSNAVLKRDAKTAHPSL